MQADFRFINQYTGVNTYTAIFDVSWASVQVKDVEDIAALGHDTRVHAAKAPTCTDNGWDAYETCNRCDHTTFVEKGALGHDVVNHDAKVPTCTEAGWDAYETCNRCDYTTFVEKGALNHDVVNHDAKAPTCTESGWDSYVTCSRCDHTTFVEKRALGHDIVSHAEKIPTCTQPGWNVYETCARTGCDYSTYEERACVAHKDESPKDHKCDYGCGKSDMGTHTAAEGTHNCGYCNVTMTQCSEGENLNHMCDVCGAVLSNCTDANKDYWCDVCGEIKTTDATGSYLVWEDFTNPYPNTYSNMMLLKRKNLTIA